MQRANVSAWNAMLHQLCPRCRAGTIFRKSVFLFPAMRERCPACDLKYEREEGYFLGAMYIGYALALGMIAIFGVLLFLPFAPVLTLMARVLWIYLDQTIDPDKS